MDNDNLIKMRDLFRESAVGRFTFKMLELSSLQ